VSHTCVGFSLIDRCLLGALCRAERPVDLQPTDSAPLAGNGSGGLAGKYAEGFASHAGLPIGQGSTSPLMTSTYGQPPGWSDVSCQPIGQSNLPANGPDSFAGRSDRATCEQAGQGDWLQTARPRAEKFAERFFAGDCQRFLKIANDRQRSPTIANDSQAQATIGNTRQRSTVKDQRISNARRRSLGLGQRSTTIAPERSTHFQRSPTQKWTIGFPSGVVR